MTTAAVSLAGLLSVLSRLRVLGVLAAVAASALHSVRSHFVWVVYKQCEEKNTQNVHFFDLSCSFISDFYCGI
jgi:hypothetical protein